MSYCRWSDDNWRCDIYAYDDVSGGIAVHVASRRVAGNIPPAPSFALLNTDMERFAREHRAVMDFLDTAERVPIGGPFDGADFTEPDLPAFLDRLTMLRAAGYHVPEWVFDTVRAEMAECAPTSGGSDGERT